MMGLGEPQGGSEKEAAICTKTGEDELEEEWSVACSDDEKYNPSMKSKGLHWEPKPEDIIHLYGTLDKEGVIELEWLCPGRRAPSPLEEEEISESDEDEKPEEKSDFDFDDESMQLKLTPRRTPGSGGPKGSAKKKTTSLDSILLNMKRHRKLEEMEKQAAVSKS